MARLYIYQQIHDLTQPVTISVTASKRQFGYSNQYESPGKHTTATITMDLPDSLTDHWIAWYFAGDAVLFLVAYFLWNAEMNGTAALLFLLALCPPLAFLAVLLEPAPE